MNLPLLSIDPCEWMVYADWTEDHNLKKPSPRTCRAIGRLLEHSHSTSTQPHKMVLGEYRYNYGGTIPPRPRGLRGVFFWDGRDMEKIEWDSPRGQARLTGRQVVENTPLVNWFRPGLAEVWFNNMQFITPYAYKVTTIADPLLTGFLSRRPKLAWRYFRALRGQLPLVWDKCLKS